MKKILSVLLLSIFLLSCSDDDKDSSVDISSLNQTLAVSATGESVSIQVNGISNDDVIVSDTDKSWISTSVTSSTLVIKVRENLDMISRTTKVKIVKGNQEAIISIEQKALDINSIGVRVALAGNSYITNKVASESVTDAGIISWTDPATVISTYIKVTKLGKMKVYLKYKNETDGNIVTFTQGTNTFDVSLTKSQASEGVISYIGEINCDKVGYICMDLQGKVLKGETFAQPSDFVLVGEATSGLVYIKDFEYYWGRRGPSVHMKYALPTTPVEWFYNEVTVPENYDPVGSYFMVCGFTGGYFGMQVNSDTERKILFSVWSPYVTDDPTTIPEDEKVLLSKSGENVIVGDFGNEGSGVQSYLKYNWKVGTTYKFITHVRPLDTGYSEYTGYFFEPTTSEWRMISQLLRPKTNIYYSGAYSFVENFNKDQGYQQRKANFGNQWAYTNNQWTEVTKGTFTGDDTAKSGERVDYAGGAENNQFFLTNGGFFDANVVLNTVFDRTANGTQPDVNLEDLIKMESFEQAYLDRTGWEVIYASTYATSGEGVNGAPAKILDGDLTSYWHSQWTGGTTDNPSNPPLPHNLVIDMKEKHTINKIGIARRNGNSDTKSGVIYTTSDDVAILIAAGKYSEIQWTEIGTFFMETTNGLQNFNTAPSESRYFMISITETRKANTSSLSEVQVVGL